MKRLLSVCAVMCILAGMCIYAGKVGTVGGWQEDSTSPEPPIGILTDSNVVDAGNHVAAYRVRAKGEENETAGGKESYLCVAVEDGYELTLYDHSNKNVFSTKFPKEPGIRWVTEDILEISISVGSPAVYVFWFDTENAKISDTYFNPILVGGKYVAYMENNEELLLRDIFGEGLLEMSVIRNFSQTADPMSAVMQIEMTDHEHIGLTYLDGPDYTEVSETIKIENGCNEKEESES